MEAPILRDVAAIDRVLRTYPWLDCEIQTFERGELLIVGGVDLHGPPPDVLIYFEDVFFMIAPCEWKTDTTQTVLSILGGEEENALRLDYGAGGEYTIYQMQAEDKRGFCRIGARGVRMIQQRAADAPLQFPKEWGLGADSKG